MSHGINMSKIVHKRSVFSFWDFLGDVGGLYDMLILIGGWAVSIIHMLTGSGLERHIIRNLFSVERKQRGEIEGASLIDQLKLTLK